MSAIPLQNLYHKIQCGRRISPAEALLLLQSGDWLEIARLARSRRDQATTPNSASYTVFSIVNYTNICSIRCKFCSFKKGVSDPGAYVMDIDDVFQKIEYAAAKGSDQLFFQGGVNSDLPLEYYLNILSAVKKRFGFHIRAFSPVELLHLAKKEKVSVEEVIGELKSAGLNSVPGAGAEILSDRVRQVLSPQKCTSGEWLNVMEKCHLHNLYGSANIVVGSIETDQEIIEHLTSIRDLQDKTGGFNSFIPWTFQDQTGDFPVKMISPHNYLKLLGICRIFLDNIKNIEVSVMVLGKAMGQLALQMGANDISSPVIEENVLTSYGVRSEEEACRLIREAGLTPYRRDFDYSHFQNKQAES